MISSSNIDKVLFGYAYRICESKRRLGACWMGWKRNVIMRDFKVGSAPLNQLVIRSSEKLGEKTSVKPNRAGVFLSV